MSERGREEGRRKERREAASGGQEAQSRARVKILCFFFSFQETSVSCSRLLLLSDECLGKTDHHHRRHLSSCPFQARVSPSKRNTCTQIQYPPPILRLLSLSPLVPSTSRAPAAFITGCRVTLSCLSWSSIFRKDVHSLTLTLSLSSCDGDLFPASDLTQDRSSF